MNNATKRTSIDAAFTDDTEYVPYTDEEIEAEIEAADQLFAEEQKETEEALQKFLLGLPATELTHLSKYVQENYSPTHTTYDSHGNRKTLTVNDLQSEIFRFRSESQSSKPVQLSLAEQLKNAETLQEKEAILEKNRLFSNPKKHIFEGKPLPGTVKTDQDRSREILNSATRNIPSRQQEALVEEVMWEYGDYSPAPRSTSKIPVPERKEFDTVNHHQVVKDFSKFKREVF